MTEKTITHCHKQACFADLLAEVEKANPRKFDLFWANTSYDGIWAGQDG